MSLRGVPSDRPPVRAGLPIVTSCSGCGTGQRAQHERIDERERRGVRADAECEREQHHRGEADVLPHRAQRVRDVLPQVAQIVGATHGALPLMVDVEAAVANGAQVAEALERLRARSIGREPRGDELLRAHGDVEVELLIDVALDVPGADADAEDPRPIAALAHAVRGEALACSAREAASTNCCHAERPVRSCARPAAVSL